MYVCISLHSAAVMDFHVSLGLGLSIKTDRGSWRDAETENFVENPQNLDHSFYIFLCLSAKKAHPKMKKTSIFFVILLTPGSSYLSSTSSRTRLNNTSSRKPTFTAASDNVVDTGLSSLSVSELKRLLSERGVDYRDCLEKRDLVERLQTSKPLHGREASSSLGFTTHEQTVIQTFKRVSGSVAYIQTTAIVPQQFGGFQLRGAEVPAGTGTSEELCIVDKVLNQGLPVYIHSSKSQS